MKKRVIVLLVVVLALGVAATSALAAPNLNYTSCFQVQNLDQSNAATIAVQYYAQDNPTPTTVNDTVPAAGSVTYCPLNAVASGFNGSAVISSDREIAAIANVSGSNGGDPSNFSSYNASYSGFSAGATTVNLPLLFQDNFGYDTRFNVQNTGASNATVNVSYSDGTSAGPVTIGPGQAHTFEQAGETHSQAVFAGTITSDQPVVATVLEVGPANQPMLFGYNGFTSSATNPVMPLVQANNFGYTSGIQIQNAGSSETSVTVSYTPSSAGTACTQTKSIAPGASSTFGLLAWDAGDADSDNDCANGETFVGAAEVTTNSASVGLVGIVNQHNFAGVKGASYGAYDPANATSTVVMPLIMDLNFGFFTGFNVMNVGSSSTTVTCTFSNDGHTETATLAPGVAMTATQYQVLAGGAGGYVGSAVCTADGGGQIIGVVNELRTSGDQDTFLTYEASNS